MVIVLSCSVYDMADPDNERVETFFKYVNTVALFSYSNIKLLETFSDYDWLPKDNFKDLAYQVKFPL